MKKRSHYPCLQSFVFLTIMCITSESYGQSNVEGVWSGTVTKKETYTGELGSSVLEITTIFNGNKGTGSMKFEGRWKTPFNSNDICTGSGNAELYEVSITESDNPSYYEYYIHVIGPDYTCSPSDGEQNKRDITISDKVLAANRNILSGTKTEIGETGTGPVKTTYSWHLTRVTGASVVLIVTPNNYDTWLPEPGMPGMSELAVGSIMKISLQLIASNGQSPKVKAKSFELRLTNTSQEPGITINWPISPQDHFLDLRFIPKENFTFISEDFQFAKIKPSNGIAGEISIGAYDGGGYTTLTAEALLEDNTRLEGHLFISGGPIEIPIPKRPANSKIGTAWLTLYGNPADNDDNEISAGNNNDGDGLSAYEEYRGIICQRLFRRLDPKEKELGVWGTQSGSYSLFSEGLKWFEYASGIKILHFYENEIGQDKRINKNAATAHIFDQYVLKLEKNTLPKNILGRANGGPDIPAAIGTIFIDVNQIASQQREMEFEAIQNNVQLPFTYEQRLAKIVAHEIGHGVNIRHHGNTALKYLDFIAQENSPFYIYDEHGNQITNRPHHVQGLVGEKGDQGSGDIFCLLNYNPGYDWAGKTDNNSIWLYRVPLVPIGNLLCNSKTGTDFNATPDYFGDATTGGNCLSQIKLK